MSSDGGVEWEVQQYPTRTHTYAHGGGTGCTITVGHVGRVSDGPEVEVGMGVGSVRVESGSSRDTESEAHGVCVGEVVMYGRAQRRGGERPRKVEWEAAAN